MIFPVFIGCFRFRHIMHPCPGDPARVDQALTCVPAALVHGSPLFIHSHLEVLSASSVAAMMAFFLIGQLMPKWVQALWGELPAKPCQPTTAQWQCARQSCPLLSSTSPCYLAFFLSNSSSMWSSQGMASCLVASDKIRMSGHKDITAMCAENLSGLPRSTMNGPSCAVVSRPSETPS